MRVSVLGEMLQLFRNYICMFSIFPGVYPPKFPEKSNRAKNSTNNICLKALGKFTQDLEYSLIFVGYPSIFIFFFDYAQDGRFIKVLFFSGFS